MNFLRSSSKKSSKSPTSPQQQQQQDNTTDPTTSAMIAPQLITTTTTTNTTQMEIVETNNQNNSPPPQQQQQHPPYSLQSSNYKCEDIIFCIDTDNESLVEMKNTGYNGRPITRLDSIKQAILMFVNAKILINPDHRFAFASLGKSASWLRKEFTSDVNAVFAALRGLSASPSGAPADLTQLFRIAAHEAKKSRSQNRILRVILLYCRSSVPPQFHWPANQALFTLDVVYLHDKPGPDNCPQKVYDALVEALERVTECEGYIYETGQGLQRILFRFMSLLLSHPQQRCMQDDLNLPMSLTKKLPANDSMQSDDSVTVISQ